MYVGMSVVSTYILVVVALNPLKNSSLPLLPWLDGRRRWSISSLMSAEFSLWYKIWICVQFVMKSYPQPPIVHP